MRRLVVVFAVWAGVGLALPGEAQEELQRALLRLPAVIGQAKQHPRKGRESIYRIARANGVSASAIHNANDGDLTSGGESLLLPTEHAAPLPSFDGVVINLPERNLYVYRQGKPVRCYPVAIGMRGWETPVGDFTIVNKKKNPTWFPPKWAVEEKPVRPGPGNPLGDRWMGLSVRGYGIHATNAPATVGRYVSHGCLRMYPEHAHELFNQVSVGTPVRIIYERAVVGYRPQDGIVYLAYYPDPYQAGDVTLAQARELLADYGLGAVVDMAALAEALQRPRGVPVPVVGSRMRVTVDGAPVRFALAPTRADGDWLVPAAPLAKALGAQLEEGQGGTYVTISRGGQRLFLSMGSTEALLNGELIELEAAPQLAAGYPLVPLRATALALGSSTGWDEATQTLHIWDGLGRTNGRAWGLE